ESARTRHQVLTVVSLRLDTFRVSAIEDAFRFLDKPFVAANKKSSSADGWIAQSELWFAARIGFHHAHKRFNQNSRCKVLAGAFLPFACRLLEQAFERSAFDIDIHRRPIFLVNHRDDPLEIDWVVKAWCRLSENVSEQSSSLAQLPKNVRVVIRKNSAGKIFQAF